MTPGDLVRFNHERNGGPLRKVVSIAPDGMVEIENMGGFFAPHLFVAVTDTPNPERLQKRCPDCFGTGREQTDEPNLIATCRMCDGEGALP